MSKDRITEAYERNLPTENGDGLSAEVEKARLEVDEARAVNESLRQLADVRRALRELRGAAARERRKVARLERLVAKQGREAEDLAEIRASRSYAVMRIIWRLHAALHGRRLESRAATRGAVSSGAAGAVEPLPPAHDDRPAATTGEQVAPALPEATQSRRTSKPKLLASADRLVREGRLNEAVRLYDGALEEDPGLEAAQSARAAALSQLAIVNGTWVEKPPPRALDVEQGRVLHLVGGTHGDDNGAATARVHALARAQGADLDVHVVAQPGSRWTVGSADTRNRDQLDGVTYHRLRNGAHDPEHLDGHLRACVERVAELVQRLRPAVIQAAPGFGNGLVALELGRRYGIPTVYEVPRPPELEPGSTAQRLELMCWSMAGRLATSDGATREHLVSSGVAPDTVTLVSADPHRSAKDLAKLYAGLGAL